MSALRVHPQTRESPTKYLYYLPGFRGRTWEQRLLSHALQGARAAPTGQNRHHRHPHAHHHHNRRFLKLGRPRRHGFRRHPRHGMSTQRGLLRVHVSALWAERPAPCPSRGRRPDAWASACPEVGPAGVCTHPASGQRSGEWLGVPQAGLHAPCPQAAAEGTPGGSGHTVPPGTGWGHPGGAGNAMHSQSPGQHSAILLPASPTQPVRAAVRPTGSQHTGRGQQKPAGSCGGLRAPSVSPAGSPGRAVAIVAPGIQRQGPLLTEATTEDHPDQPRGQCEKEKEKPL